MWLHLLEVIVFTGAIVPAILGAAWILWTLGVRDPFLLALLAIVIGGVAGWAINEGLGRILRCRHEPSAERRLRAAPRRTRRQ